MTALQHSHVVSTWLDYKVSNPVRLLADTWPKVQANPGGGLEEAVPLTSPHHSSERAWIATLAAFDELRAYSDLATLLRRGVELLREAVGLERAAIFLLRADGRLEGTFGTGTHGETTDERHIAFEMGQSHREAFTLSNQGVAQWSRFSRVPLFAQSGDRTVVVRTGENVIIPIPGNRGCLGLIACDWALTGSPSDNETLLRAAVFARVISPLLTPLWKSVEPPTLATPGTSAKQLVGAAIRRLRVDPNEDRHAIAKALGTTADKLGRVFKAEMGETLPEYRNRLRLERFFSVVEASGGNLLRSALDAGFGSYAQFHRVFHQTFKCAPIDYLKRRAAHEGVPNLFPSAGDK